MRDAPPIFQVLTLSGNVASKGEKLRLKAAAADDDNQDEEPSFRARALQTIKAQHQSKIGTGFGSPSARQISSAHGRASLTGPPGIAATGRLRDFTARSETKMLHDAGLRVSALKVAQRQPMELSQGSNTSSPYSVKGSDLKPASKTRGVVRSATFSAGSTGPSDATALREHPLGQLSNRGVRPNSAPASSDMQHSLDSGRQTVKRRQVTASYEPPSALPGFRPGPCLTADSHISRARHSLRPGTPITKAEAASAATSLASSMKATSGREVRDAAVAASKAASGSQDLPISRWSRSSAGSVTAAATALNMQTASLSNAELLKGQDSSVLTRSNSGNSSSAAGVQESTQGQAKKASQLFQSAVRGPRSPVRRSLSQGSIPSASSLGPDSLSPLTTPSTVLSPPRKSKSLDIARRKGNEDSHARGMQDGTTKHMSGNSVVSYISRNPSPVAAKKADLSADNARNVHPCSSAESLREDSNSVMQWLGMDDMWFENDFLPFAERTLTNDTFAQ